MTKQYKKFIKEYTYNQDSDNGTVALSDVEYYMDKYIQRISDEIGSEMESLLKKNKKEIMFFDNDSDAIDFVNRIGQDALYKLRGFKI